MPVTNLFHIAIKTADLDATLRFYTEVLGLVAAKRPAFDFPGAWLASPQPGGDPIIHIYAGGAAVGQDGRVPSGTGSIDHVSVSALGYHDYIARFREHGLDWRENKVPGTDLWQLFVYDPSGMQFELTFNGAVEPGPEPDMSETRRYRAGTSFFRPLVPAE